MNDAANGTNGSVATTADELLKEARAKLAETTNLGSLVKRTAADDALFEASKLKMKELLDKPLTQRSLFEIEKVAKLLRSLLATTGAPEFAPVRGYGLVGSYDGGIDAGFGDSGMTVLAPSSPPENFGANLIREAMAFLGEQKKENRKRDKSRDLVMKVEAVAAARERGLTKIADKLEKEILDEEEKDDEVVHSDVER